MLSRNPVDLGKLNEKELNQEILRLGMIAELDAVSFYEQLATKTSDPKIKKLLVDILREEKTHIGEFQELLKRADPEYAAELKKGEQEVAKLGGK